MHFTNRMKLGESLRQLNISTIEKCRRSLASFRERKDIGFPFLPDRRELVESVLNTGEEFRNRFKYFVVVGIGGSSLGGLAIAEAIQAEQVHFLDNVDVLQLRRLLLKIEDLREWGWVFISKSGTTIETLATLEWIEAHYIHHGLRLSNQSLVITEPVSNSLGNWADRHKVPRLSVPLDVGGRFSVLSPVGLLPAYLMGLDPEKILAGAKEALEASELVAALMAHFVLSFERGEWITLFWQYSTEMKSFGGWIQQLWCESLGKKLNRQGGAAPRASTAMWAVGASDQHSILQQVMDGHRDKFVIFMRYEDLERATPTDFIGTLQGSQFMETQSLIGKSFGSLLSAEATATAAGLASEGISTLNIHVGSLNEGTLGFLFMTFQLVVAGLGEYQEINAFDQPGVELGKKLAKKILQDGHL